MMNDANTLLQLLKDISPLLTLICAVLLVIVFFLPIILKILKENGILKDRNSTDIYNRLKSIDDKLIIVLDSKENWDEHIERQDSFQNSIGTMISNIYNMMGGHLSNSQVDAVIEITFMYIINELCNKFIEYSESTQNISDEFLKLTFNDVITKADTKFFSLPNTKALVISTKDKIDSFVDKKYSNGKNTPLEVIIHILQDENDQRNKKESITLLLTELTRYWKRT